MTNKNEKCFIGLPACGNISESAKACFIAYPSDDCYKVKVDMIEGILKSKQYECHRAIKNTEPGILTFCTKICSKIIQSQFCIVLLDPSKNQQGDLPNPNVHFEYGMMLAQNKLIIPLQEEGNKLAFNIAPLDTIKYTESTFTTKVTTAIENAIEKFSKTENAGTSVVNPDIQVYYNTLGYKISDLNITFYKLLAGHGLGLGFYLLEEKSSQKYKFLGIFPYEDPKKIVLHTKTLIESLSSSYLKLTQTEEGKKNPSGYLYLINDISIDLIIPSFYDKTEVIEKIQKMVNNNEYIISALYLSNLQDFMVNQYNAVGEFKKK